MDVELPKVIADHIAAVNAHDLNAVMATFAEDALVNDACREFWGAEQIRAWVAKEMVGDRVQIEPTACVLHHDQIVLRGRYDGDFDKTNLPAELILTNYVTTRNGKIESLIVIFNQSGVEDGEISPAESN